MFSPELVVSGKNIQGEYALVFDDTYAHEIWNDACGARVVLAIRFARPLRQPGKWFADLLPRT